MNDGDLICPFCHGTGKIKVQNCPIYYFDNASAFAQPMSMNIKYTVNAAVGGN